MGSNIILFHILKVYEVINWRANQVPAAAVILVPRVCMMIDAVKKSVVYFFKKQYEVYCIVGRKMKCDDPDWTNRSESCTLVCIF